MSLSRKNSRVVTASCPARVDIGNSLDYPSYFYSLPNGSARTMNIAVELRTTVTWSPAEPGRISFRAGPLSETHSGTPVPAESQFPALCLLLNHFHVTAGDFRIDMDVPVGSGLGGSGMLVIAMLALIKDRQLGGLHARDWPSLLLVAHLFENWLGFSCTGFHDQLAALYGGANLWTWGSHFRQSLAVFRRTPVVPRGGARELSRHLLLCFTGQAHRPIRARPHFRCLPGGQLPQWSAVANHAGCFADALREGDWAKASRHLNAECDLRGEMNPACLSERARQLIAAGRGCGVGCRYAGHGHGGCVWACGTAENLEAARERWSRLAQHWRGAWVIQPKVAAKGLVIR